MRFKGKSALVCGAGGGIECALDCLELRCHRQEELPRLLALCLPAVFRRAEKSREQGMKLQLEASVRVSWRGAWNAFSQTAHCRGNCACGPAPFGSALTAFSRSSLTSAQRRRNGWSCYLYLAQQGALAAKRLSYVLQFPTHT